MCVARPRYHPGHTVLNLATPESSVACTPRSQCEDSIGVPRAVRWEVEERSELVDQPEYSPIASACQISAKTLGTVEQFLAFRTVISRDRGMPGRSSVMFVRTRGCGM